MRPTRADLWQLAIDLGQGCRRIGRTVLAELVSFEADFEAIASVSALRLNRLVQAHHYRLPELLHDNRLLDLLELCTPHRFRAGAHLDQPDPGHGPPCSAGRWATGPRLPGPTVWELGRMGDPQQLEG